MAAREKRPESDFITVLARNQQNGVYVELVQDTRCDPPYLVYVGKEQKQRLLFFWHRDEARARQEHATISKEWGLTND